MVSFCSLRGAAKQDTLREQLLPKASDSQRTDADDVVRRIRQHRRSTPDDAPTSPAAEPRVALPARRARGAAARGPQGALRARVRRRVAIQIEPRGVADDGDAAFLLTTRVKRPLLRVLAPSPAPPETPAPPLARQRAASLSRFTRLRAQRRRAAAARPRARRRRNQMVAARGLHWLMPAQVPELLKSRKWDAVRAILSAISPRLAMSRRRTPAVERERRQTVAPTATDRHQME